MSCDNIPGNGHVTENAVAGLAELSDPELAALDPGERRLPQLDGRPHHARPPPTASARSCATPMASRTPGRCSARSSGNGWSRTSSRAGRPALEKVGVTFTGDVAPYELMKIRILNGGHAAIAYPAGLLDIHFVHEAMEDAQIAAFLETLDEARDHSGRAAAAQRRSRGLPRRRSPSASPIPRSATRSAASASTARTGSRSSSCRRRATGSRPGASVKGLALVSALWCRYAYGESESGKVIPPNDPSWDRLQAAAKPARDDPRAFLAMRDIFGDLADNPAYVAAFSGALGSLWTKGVRATLAEYLERGA